MIKIHSLLKIVELLKQLFQRLEKTLLRTLEAIFILLYFSINIYT